MSGSSPARARRLRRSSASRRLRRRSRRRSSSTTRRARSRSPASPVPGSGAAGAGSCSPASARGRRCSSSTRPALIALALSSTAAARARAVVPARRRAAGGRARCVQLGCVRLAVPSVVPLRREPVRRAAAPWLLRDRGADAPRAARRCSSAIARPARLLAGPPCGGGRPRGSSGAAAIARRRCSRRRVVLFCLLSAGYFLPYGGGSPGPRFSRARRCPFLALGLPCVLARCRVADAWRSASPRQRSRPSMRSRWGVRPFVDTSWVPDAETRSEDGLDVGRPGSQRRRARSCSSARSPPSAAGASLSVRAGEEARRASGRRALPPVLRLVARRSASTTIATATPPLRPLRARDDVGPLAVPRLLRRVPGARAAALLRRAPAAGAVRHELQVDDGGLRHRGARAARRRDARARSCASPSRQASSAVSPLLVGPVFLEHVRPVSRAAHDRGGARLPARPGADDVRPARARGRREGVPARLAAPRPDRDLGARRARRGAAGGRRGSAVCSCSCTCRSRSSALVACASATGCS